MTMPLSDLLGLAFALAASAETGLLAQLVEGPPRTPAEHAHACGLDPRATALVLDALVARGIAERTGDAIGAGPALLELVRAPGGIARTIELWSHVPAFLRTGVPFLRMDAAREVAYAGVVGALGQLFEGVARDLADRLALSPRRILDIGCGSGVWSLALAARHPQARVTGLDLPAVLEAFRARAAEQGLADRIDALPGDVHATAIPRAFDVVVVANVLRIEPPDRARAIVETAAAALEPGGSLVIVDALSGGTPEREQARTIYALHLGMRTEHGRVYARDEIVAWVRETGLGEVRFIVLEARPAAIAALHARA